MNDQVLRDQLVELLTEGHAHLSLDAALKAVPRDLRGRRPGRSHSAWQLLEHMRLAQEDIFRYTLDPKWKSPEFPEGYWPKRPVPTDAEWKACLKAFRKDLDELVAFVRDPKTDLTARLPHGEGRTYLRQVLLVADHNAYHLGQLVQARKQLAGTKKK
jgi:DinB superfamily